MRLSAGLTLLLLPTVAIRQASAQEDVDGTPEVERPSVTISVEGATPPIKPPPESGAFTTLISNTNGEGTPPIKPPLEPEVFTTLVVENPETEPVFQTFADSPPPEAQVEPIALAFNSAPPEVVAVSLALDDPPEPERQFSTANAVPETAEAEAVAFADTPPLSPVFPVFNTMAPPEEPIALPATEFEPVFSTTSFLEGTQPVSPPPGVVFDSPPVAEVEAVAFNSPPIAFNSVPPPEEPIALPSITSETEAVAFANAVPETAFDSPPVDFNSAAPETSDSPPPFFPSEPLCDKNGKTNADVDVAFESTISCTNCRTFEGKAAADGTCPVGSGWELHYGFGANRADVKVTSCPDLPLLTVDMTGPDTAAFTTAERNYLNKLAQNIEDGTAVDVSVKGSLDALAVDASRALAAWPASQFPIGNFDWVGGNTPAPAWFDFDLLIRKDACSFVPVGDGNLAPPSPATPTDAPVKAPTDAPQPAPTTPPKNPGNPGGVAPTPSPTGCVDICHVTSDDEQLTLISNCVGPSDLSEHLALHPCDYEITPGCGCDEIDDMNEFRSCVQASGSARPDCPLDDPVDRLDEEGELKPVVPTPAPTDCVDVCHMEGNFNADGERIFRATASCLSPAEVQTHLAAHGCDWRNDRGVVCDCSAAGELDLGMFNFCRNSATCPDFEDGRLDENGVVQDQPVCTSICHVYGTDTNSIGFREQCLEPSKAKEDLVNHPCDFEITDDCGCESSTTTFATIQSCNPACTANVAGRLDSDGTVTPAVPTPAPTDCVQMCHIEYTPLDSGGVQVNTSPQCIPPGEVEAQLAANDCDWAMEGRPECDCLASINDQSALGTMLNTCSPQNCGARTENLALPPTPTPVTWCHLEFMTSADGSGGTQVTVEERNYASQAEVDAEHAGHACDWTVTNDCPCIENGEFDTNLVATCAPNSCPQNNQGTQGGRRELTAVIVRE